MTNRVLINFIATAKMFFRSKGAVFWTVAFPVLLIVLFGAIFSSSATASYTIYVQNQDQGPMSQMFVEGLNQTKVLNVVYVDRSVNPDQYVKDNSISSFLIIPSNFTSSIAQHQNVTVELRQDQTSNSAYAVTTAVNAVVQGTNLALANGTPLVGIESKGIAANDQLNYIDFFLPGVIGLTAMTTTVNWMVGLQTRYRENGIFKKLATTPITHTEWLISLIMWQVITVFISVAIIMVVGSMAFHVHLALDRYSIAIIICASAMFSAMGLIIARFVKEPQTAGAAAGAITFPMMFLGGSFFPLEQMPLYLQIIARLMPLTYVNNGLRDAMIYGNSASALDNLLIVAVIMVVFMVIGVLISTWKQE